VLRFLGDAFRLGDGFVRPHEIVLGRFPGDGAIEVEVERIVVVGADVRVDLADGTGERMTARLRREDIDELELVRGEIVWATTAQPRLLPAPPLAGDAEAGQPLG
jgi:ABC-type sulfate/molybdate transport systems ATPase subunit